MSFTAEDAEHTEMEEGERLNQVTEQTIGAAIAVHRALGPELLESAYEACLFHDTTRIANARMTGSNPADRSFSVAWQLANWFLTCTTTWLESNTCEIS